MHTEVRLRIHFRITSTSTFMHTEVDTEVDTGIMGQRHTEVEVDTGFS